MKEYRRSNSKTRISVISGENICYYSSGEPLHIRSVRNKDFSEERQKMTDAPSRSPLKKYGNESLVEYMSEIRHYALLTKEQEFSLGKKIQSGERKALETMVNANLRFVVSIAKKYSRLGVPLLDLIQEGNYGLMHAAEKFNPDLGIRFISYAVWHIRKHIFTYIGNNLYGMDIPQRIQHLLMKIDMIYKDQLPSHQTLASQFHLSRQKALNLGQIVLKLQSLETLPDNINPRVNGVENKVIHSFQPCAIENSLGFLSEKESLAVVMYFGLRGDTIGSYEKLGKILHLSHEGARRTVKKAIEKLQGLNIGLEEFLEP